MRLLDLMCGAGGAAVGYHRAGFSEIVGDRRRRQSAQDFSTQERRKAMGIDWMTGAELSQAIPPAYTEFVGSQLLAQVARV